MSLFCQQAVSVSQLSLSLAGYSCCCVDLSASVFKTKVGPFIPNLLTNRSIFSQTREAHNLYVVTKQLADAFNGGRVGGIPLLV